LLRPLGNTVYVLPPYCVTEDDLERIYDAIESAARAILR
jgi:adenosylmethionine-8-amino-7-oxononanoate aminotransferase